MALELARTVPVLNRSVFTTNGVLVVWRLAEMVPWLTSGAVELKVP